MSHVGDQHPSYRESSEEDSQSQLFIFCFEKSDILKQYIVSPPDSPQQQKTLSFVTLEETCNLYLQQRFVFFVSYASLIWICGIQIPIPRTELNHFMLYTTVVSHHVFPMFSCEERCLWMKGTKLSHKRGSSYRKLLRWHNRDTAELQIAEALQLLVQACIIYVAITQIWGMDPEFGWLCFLCWVRQHLYVCCWKAISNVHF